MTRSLEALARLLPGEDREAILGDICESGLSNLNAHFDLSALIWRRCLPPYAGVGDWLCIAVAAIISPLLVGLSVALSTQAAREIQAGSFLGIVELLRLCGLLWAASLGVGIAVMSRARTIAVLATIAILTPAIACALRYHGSDLQMGFLFLFAIPTLYGAWIGYRQRHYHRVGLIFMLLVTLMLGPPIISHGYTILNAFLLAAPAMYCWSIQSFGARHAHA
ncbi:MAG TPA: hypothetical protein VHX63_00115 [Acidobacteriaceae bacterium]|jgi:hypothetical protein|nr:hypothetical protein [Acidobacteriaceae bacterium]